MTQGEQGLFFLMLFIFYRGSLNEITGLWHTLVAKVYYYNVMEVIYLINNLNYQCITY